MFFGVHAAMFVLCHDLILSGIFSVRIEHIFALVTGALRQMLRRVQRIAKKLSVKDRARPIAERLAHPPHRRPAQGRPRIFGDLARAFVGSG